MFNVIPGYGVRGTIVAKESNMVKHCWVVTCKDMSPGATRDPWVEVVTLSEQHAAKCKELIDAKKMMVSAEVTRHVLSGSILR